MVCSNFVVPVFLVFSKALIFSWMKNIRPKRILQKYEIVFVGAGRAAHFCPCNADVCSWHERFPALFVPRTSEQR